MLLRPGNAGSNTAADHPTVLTEALAQTPGASTAKILVRVDACPSTPGPSRAATSSPSCPNTRTGWPHGVRLLVRRVRPSGRQLKKLNPFEIKTGWRYSIIATNIRKMTRIRGSHQPQWLDAAHRAHAVVEDRVRCDKAMGLNNLPSQSWEVNRGWMLAANLAHDLDVWVKLLALHDVDDLADAEPDTIRFRLHHLPARLSRHARRRWLRIDGPPLTTANHPDDENQKERTSTTRARGTRRSRGVTRRPTPNDTGTFRANRRTNQRPNPADGSRPVHFLRTHSIRRSQMNAITSTARAPTETTRATVSI
ncbi:transposase [Streptomyces sp. NPDC003042]